MRLRHLILICGLLALAACQRQHPPADAKAIEQPLRGVVEAAADRALPPPLLGGFDFEVLCNADQLDLRRDALLAKARELGGNAVEALRANERERRVAVTLPGPAVTTFRTAAGATTVAPAPGERESFDVTLRAP